MDVDLDKSAYFAHIVSGLSCHIQSSVLKTNFIFEKDGFAELETFGICVYVEAGTVWSRNTPGAFQLWFTAAVWWAIDGLHSPGVADFSPAAVALCLVDQEQNQALMHWTMPAFVAFMVDKCSPGYM